MHDVRKRHRRNIWYVALPVLLPAAKSARLPQAFAHLSSRKCRCHNGAYSAWTSKSARQAHNSMSEARSSPVPTPDRRRKPEAEKAKNRAARIARASATRRLSHWKRAANATEAAGQPLNLALHITWSALEAGDRQDGHCLGLPQPDRDKRLWSSLRAVAVRAGVPWLAFRAPEYDRRRGLHVHLGMHLPQSRKTLLDAIATISRLTGASAAWVSFGGRSVPGLGGRIEGVVARSYCGGWMLQLNLRATNGGGSGIASYASKGAGKRQATGQHRLSTALSQRACRVGPGKAAGGLRRV